jgi:peptidoglycan hydrolase-like protein with peptidoglycan-binding domain
MADPTAVRYLQTALNSQGYPVPVNGKYDKATIAAVFNFQGVRLDRKGRHLKADGWVGPATWWAIQNPSGASQKSNLEGDTRKGLSAERRAIIKAFLKDHTAGVREIPDGANYGDGVTRYLTVIGPAYWCCYAVSTWHKDAVGTWPFGERFGLVAGIWNEAKERGRAILKEDTSTAVPGDAFVMLYRNAKGRLTGLGHIGLVLTASQDGESFNTGEGNAGNRVKISRRETDQDTLVGYIDFFGDRAAVLPKFERGLLSKSEAADSSLAGTR